MQPYPRDNPRSQTDVFYCLAREIIPGCLAAVAHMEYTARIDLHEQSHGLCQVMRKGRTTPLIIDNLNALLHLGRGKDCRHEIPSMMPDEPLRPDDEIFCHLVTYGIFSRELAYAIDIEGQGWSSSE